ncbi:MAG TPA: hypothetical protein VJY34_14205 [Roseiarcus sp.]|nr:hypothetical protein [Roseiarcus sp.]
MSLEKQKASDAEREKLVAEIQDLIKEKQLDVNLTIGRPVTPTLRGCSQCTICPCMICW